MTVPTRLLYTAPKPVQPSTWLDGLWGLYANFTYLPTGLRYNDPGLGSMAFGAGNRALQVDRKEPLAGIHEPSAFPAFCLFTATGLSGYHKQACLFVYCCTLCAFDPYSPPRRKIA